MAEAAQHGAIRLVKIATRFARKQPPPPKPKPPEQDAVVDMLDTVCELLAGIEHELRAIRREGLPVWWDG